MIVKTLMTVILIAFSTGSAFATITGKELYNYCTGNTKVQDQGRSKQFCMGYIAGFLDTYVLTAAMHRIATQNRLFCLGIKGISYQKAMNIAVKYFQNNPDSLNQSARQLLIKAYANQYPCETNRFDQQQTPRFEQNRLQNNNQKNMKNYDYKKNSYKM